MVDEDASLVDDLAAVKAHPPRKRRKGQAGRGGAKKVHLRLVRLLPHLLVNPPLPPPGLNTLPYAIVYPKILYVLPYAFVFPTLLPLIP